MTTSYEIGEGGGIESLKTLKAKSFIINFFKIARTVINNVDVIIKEEYKVHCPPMYLREESKRYQVDVALIILGYEVYNIGIEIDGEVGHKHKLKDEARDQWIYQNKGLPIFRLKLDWIIDWMKTDDYKGLLEELIYQHNAFKFGKLPKNPVIHLAHKCRGELFG